MKKSVFLIVVIAGLLFCSCGQNKQSPFSKEYETRTGKAIVLSETHPRGRSSSTIEISTKDFEHDISERIEDADPISAVFMADLDGNGFDEIYIITTSSGSGSYGTVIGFASNKDKSLSIISFPDVKAGGRLFDGYMGHDSFTIEGNKLVRSFPVYNKGDANSKPTGGMQKLIYSLHPGEAMWQLKIDKAIHVE
jgi:hypothetical protein